MPPVLQRLFRSFFRIAHFMVCVVVSAFVSGLATLTLSLKVFNPIERAFADFSVTDIYFTIMRSEANKELNPDIVLVDITKQHRRGEIAQTIRDIAACQPRLVVFDLIFQVHGDDEFGNMELMEALEELPRKVMACKLTDYSPAKGEFTGIVKSFFSDLAPYDWAYANVPKNLHGGTLRNFTLSQPCQRKTYYSLPYLTACAYQGKAPYTEDTSEHPINFGNTDFITIPCDSVRRYANLLQDRIVIVGTMTEETDMHMTALGKLPGMKMQAFATYTCMQHGGATRMGRIKALLLMFILCYLSAWAGYEITQRFAKSRISWVSIYYFLLTAFLVWASFLCFVHYNYIVSLTLPLLGIALVEKSRTYYGWFIGLIRRHPTWKRLNRLVCHSIYYTPSNSYKLP